MLLELLVHNLVRKLAELGMLLIELRGESGCSGIGIAGANRGTTAALSSGQVLARKEILTKVGESTSKGLRRGRAVKHGSGKRGPLLCVAQSSKHLGKVQTMRAVHRVPAHSLLEGVARGLVLMTLDVDVGQVGIQAIERRLDL